MNIGLTRAEIAVLMAYSKITIYNELIKSDLPDDPYYAHDLRNYFPKIMREKYQAEIDNHILRREIIATGIANSIVNRMDLSFYFFAQDDSGARGSDIAKAYTVTRDSFELRGIWVELEQLDPKINVADKVVLFTEISKLVSRCVFWLLRNENDTISVELKVAEFRPVIKEVTANLDKMLNGKTKERYQDKLSKFLEMSIPKSLARKIASISVLSSAYDIVHIASKNNLPVQNIGKIYFELGTRLNFDWLRACIDKIKIDSYWQRLSLKTLKDDLYDLQREITSAVLEHNKDLSSDPITKWCKNNQQLIERYDHFITDLLAQEVIDFPMIVLGLKRAGLLLKAVN
jgi:glutamate dehydrogenase